MTISVHTGAVDLQTPDVVESRPSRLDDLLRRVSGPVNAFRAIPNVATWSGVVIVAAGALLLVVAWVRTAALTNVGLQMPYVVSAGFTGVALVAVGLTVVNLAAKRADAQERSRQLTELRDVLAQVRAVLDEEES